MKNLLFAAALLTLPLIVSAQDNKVETQPQENYIQVTGKAEREIVPDEIFIRIVLDENSPIKKMAIDKQEAEMIKALKSIGIDTEKDLSVTNLEGGYRTYILRRNQGTVVKTYQLKVASAAVLADVYRQMDAINVSDVSVTRVYHSKMKEIGNELRVEAAQDAQAQARVLAEAVGQKAGRAIMISDYGHMSIQGAEIANDGMMRMKSVVASDQSAAEEAAIEFRKIKLNCTVQVKFVLD